MKILGIGNAIVDVICKVDDKYLEENGLTKSTMKLVDEAEFKKLLSTDLTSLVNSSPFWSKINALNWSDTLLTYKS